ncbi:hypothetical protein ACFP2F_20420 [Hymenobacter artigasi]|uniref:CopG family transcriptional regulator n=1 Tax=Hymenobacter artigasi TaxID=2719616 RepID=A0ABX1HMV3_9BACT|nr:hypothetical protein [Hymenobacter artigasi]NKI91588.1 hypothetical protein [Hymenobacter artigasi]
MKAEKSDKPRKPQLNLALDAGDKSFIESVAKARRLSVTGLIRTLVFDEGRRLGMQIPE